ncbi:MAG: gluconokinase [Arachidicoccus sp.]|nr:gluconokinase [Arachidicoccus sp.]
MQGKCVIVMGVSGSGKSTVAAAVAQKMNALFIEGDSLHPKENIDKMEHGIPLNDEDREGWLKKIHALIEQITTEGKDCVVSCSALKIKYRAVLRKSIDNILFIYLKGSYDLIHKWVENRSSHFMPPSLLKSQFADLEEPAKDEKDVVIVKLVPYLENEMAQIFKALSDKYKGE